MVRLTLLGYELENEKFQVLLYFTLTKFTRQNIRKHQRSIQIESRTTTSPSGFVFGSFNLYGKSIGCPMRVFPSMIPNSGNVFDAGKRKALASNEPPSESATLTAFFCWDRGAFSTVLRTRLGFALGRLRLAVELALGRLIEEVLTCQVAPINTLELQFEHFHKAQTVTRGLSSNAVSGLITEN